MKNLSYMLLFVAFATFTSCNTAYVTSDYDREVNFGQYKTYNFYTDINWKNMNEFDQRAMLKSIEKELAKDGLTKSDTPDILIDVLVNEKLVKRQAGSVGIGSGSFGRGVSVGVSVGIPISTQKMNKNYVVEMVDAQNDHLIWQGVYEKDVSAKSNSQELIPQAIEKLFNQFPPQKK